MGIQNAELDADLESVEKIVKKSRENSYRRKVNHCAKVFSLYIFW
jgi:hypothetical protein